jgi:16S rRNA (cytosine967-C5)-methyltransferase
VHPAAIAHERDERIKRLAGKIDRVIVDAPCSGLGTLRRNPDLKWRQSPAGFGGADGQAGGHPGQRRPAAEARRPHRLRHLQPAAGGKRGHCRRFRRRPPRIPPLPVQELLEQAKVADAASLCSADGSRPAALAAPARTDGFFAAAWEKVQS